MVFIYDRLYETMEVGFCNRNSRRSEKHLKISVNNEESNFDGSRESQNPKIEPSNAKSTTNSVRISSGLEDERRLHRSRPRIKFPIKNSQKIPQVKNEILSRTIIPSGNLSVRHTLKILICVIVMTVVINGQFVSVDSAPVKTTETTLRKFNKEVSGSYNRTLRGEEWERQNKFNKLVNKNCKEYDITSRAFLSDLIFEGTARSRSNRPSGRYVTFVIQKILKQKNNSMRPKTQIRLHFGGKANRRLSRVNPLNDCPLYGLGNVNAAKTNVKVGENYYVFADTDRVGTMSYKAKGEPIVVNKRNLKSIRSVLSRNKEKPPRVLGLKDVKMNIRQPLRLNCQVRGRPVPRINWYKDGAPLIPSSHVNVTYYRRNSTVEIKSTEFKDGGVYECRATSVTGKTAKASAEIKIYSRMTDPDKPYTKCPVDAYCLNGGQCFFIEVIGEHYCRCEAGYVGARCENKDVSLGIRSQICGFNVGYSSYYC